jgi:hypothetical protein
MAAVVHLQNTKNGRKPNWLEVDIFWGGNGEVHHLNFDESRFAPILPADGECNAPSANATFLRSIGGDELNVCVDISLLGRKSQWVSVLPTG